MKYYQAGDVLLFECQKPNKFDLLKTDLLYKGENHHHKLRGEFEIAEDGEKDRYVFSKGCEHYHEEHKAFFLPEGFYKLRIVMEYDHIKEESRQVID